MKGESSMRLVDKYISEITEFLKTLEESQLQYILTFIKKMFGDN